MHLPNSFRQVQHLEMFSSITGFTNKFNESEINFKRNKNYKN